MSHPVHYFLLLPLHTTIIGRMAKAKEATTALLYETESLMTGHIAAPPDLTIEVDPRERSRGKSPLRSSPYRQHKSPMRPSPAKRRTSSPARSFVVNHAVKQRVGLSTSVSGVVGVPSRVRRVVERQTSTTTLPFSSQQGQRGGYYDARVC